MPRPLGSSRAKVRNQNRANFEKEEELARLSEAKLGRPLSLGEMNTKSGKGRNRIIQARLYGPAIRREEPIKAKEKKAKP